MHHGHRTIDRRIEKLITAEIMRLEREQALERAQERPRTNDRPRSLSAGPGRRPGGGPPAP